MISEFLIDSLYSNEEVYKSLHIANAGGVRVSIKEKMIIKAAIMTSFQQLHSKYENPYHDRLENEVLTYTATGKIGEQTLSGINNRIIEQKTTNFPIHGFVLIANRRDKSVGPKRWRYLGLLEFLKYYSDTQLDSNGKVRKVWIFEFKIHQHPKVVPLALDKRISEDILSKSRQFNTEADNEVITVLDPGQEDHYEEIEQIRSQLLLLDPRKFEYFIKELLVRTGFIDVCVTKFSADGGVDVNAKAGSQMWVFENILVQVQAKRWLHSVGRKEVAELRGSLQPFARGVVVTTSHFSKAAINEANEDGKKPISLIDGFRLSKVIRDHNLPIAKYSGN
jgi:HJR/Mrr/RecB family endonuclease